ncbi:MAG: beta-propeller domain-containing protein, partial [Pseudomonadota bacterium]
EEDGEEQQEPPQPENHIYVLTEDVIRIESRNKGTHQRSALPVLETIGHLGGLGMGERIQSVRFVGDKAFVVTFRQVDPLFTIDVSKPEAPVLVGELKVPGFSTYLHPVDDSKRLLSIGYGGDEDGTNWRTQISLFDVRDFANPLLQDVQELAMPNTWAWSEALWEHKAFQYWAPKKLLAVPVASYQCGYVTVGKDTETDTGTDTGTDPESGAGSSDGAAGEETKESPDSSTDEAEPRGEEYRCTYDTRLQLITVDMETGLDGYGTISHSHLYNRDSSRYWNWWEVRRSIFMGDYIYAIGEAGITVTKLEGLEPVTEQLLPGYSREDLYWWW